MNPIFRSVITGLSLTAACAQIAHAQEPDDAAKAEIAQLRQQVQDLTILMKDLQQKIESKTAETPAQVAPAPIHSNNSEPAAETTQTRREPDFMTDLSADPLPAPKQFDSSIFNPEISASIDTIGSYSSSANNANFTVRDMELMVQSNVDQVARAYAVFNAESELDPWTKTDPFGEVSVGVEEAAIETTALPYGLVLKGGQFFADFSRLGKVHSHEMPFPDRPASQEGIIGGETKSRGVELSWVPPVGHYVRLTAGAVDSIGAETAATGVFGKLDGNDYDLFDSSDSRSLGDITYYGRAATIFELGESTSLNLGVDYAHGQNAGRRQMASADFKLTWLPDATSFDRLEVGGEYLQGKTTGNFNADASAAGGPTSGSSTSNGAYVYAQYRIGKNWEPGIRYDWFNPESWSETDVNSDTIADGLIRSTATQTSVSAYLTYHVSELNRLRFGVSRANGESGDFNGKDSDWLCFLQWSIIIGSHKHSFQP